MTLLYCVYSVSLYFTASSFILSKHDVLYTYKVVYMLQVSDLRPIKQIRCAAGKPWYGPVKTGIKGMRQVTMFLQSASSAQSFINSQPIFIFSLSLISSLFLINKHLHSHNRLFFSLQQYTSIFTF